MKNGPQPNIIIISSNIIIIILGKKTITYLPSANLYTSGIDVRMFELTDYLRLGLFFNVIFIDSDQNFGGIGN